MQTPSDPECIRKILNGETRFFALLVDRYQVKAYNLCMRTLRNAEAAGECTHEAFIRAYTGLGSFRLGSTFSTWFYRIVFNTCMNRLRADRAVMDRSAGDGDAWTEPACNDAVGILDQEDRKKLLDSAFKILRPDERFMVEQFYHEESTIEELSVITGLTPANVKVRLFRARQKMHKEIKRILKKEYAEWQQK